MRAKSGLSATLSRSTFLILLRQPDRSLKPYVPGGQQCYCMRHNSRVYLRRHPATVNGRSRDTAATDDPAVVD